MRWRIINTIFKKELLETVRDRRTLFIMLFLPVVLYPMILIGFSQIVQHQLAKWQETVGRVMVVGDVPEELKASIDKDEALELVKPTDLPELPDSIPVVTRTKTTNGFSKGLMRKQTSFETLEYDKALKAWAQTAIADGKADVVFLAPLDFVSNVMGNSTGTALVFYNETNENSISVFNRLYDLLMAYRQQVQVTRRNKRPDLESGFFRPLFIETSNVATARSRGGYFAGRFLPMMVIIMVMLGAFYPAVDLTAGEKERGTMETLLTAPAKATEIILGKFLTVSCISITSALINLGSMALAIFYLLQAGGMSETQLNFKLDASTGLIIFLQLIPVSVFFSSSMLAVAVLARSYKEAQNYLTPLYILVVIPITLSALPGTELTVSSAWIPVINVTMLMKEMLVKVPEWPIVLMVLLANTVYSALTLAVAVRVFQSENLLLGGKVTFRDVMTGGRRTSRPTPAFSIVLFAVTLVLYLYVGGWLQRTAFFASALDFVNLFIGLGLSQVVILLTVPIVIVSRMKMSVKDTFSLRLPSARHLAAAVLIGGSSWAFLSPVLTALQNKFFSMPDMMKQSMEEMMKRLGLGDSAAPTILLIVGIALVPAICEEFLFRGPILAGFRNGMSKWGAIACTALFFGVMHVSVYRIIPTAVIGLVATILVWESRSLLCGIVFHFLHNGCTVFFYRQESTQRFLDPSVPGFNWAYTAMFGVVFVMGFVLVYVFRSSTTVKESGEI